MPVYSDIEVAHYWQIAGGQLWATGLALAVARAESGFNSDAHSPADDWGLWQINAINLPRFGANRVTARDPLFNAQMAVSMSGGGLNWAAWCTAWADPGPNCGHGSLPVPQAGSAAGQFLATYASYGEHKPIPGGAFTGPSEADNLEAAWVDVQYFHGAYAQARYNSFNSLANTIKGLRK